MYVIVGLGNPGRKYAATRHNLGFMAVDRLARLAGTEISRRKFDARVADAVIAGEKTILVKPQTYMNLSGYSVRQVTDYYRTPHDHLIVIYDDFDIERGVLRIRRSGSAGTHNGMRSVVGELGYSDFPRIRIGIGSHEDRDAIEHVIGKIPEEEMTVLEDAAGKAAEACVCIIKDGIDKAMNLYNGHS